MSLTSFSLSSSHVVIIEAFLSGHHRTYLNRLLDIFSEANFSVTLVIPKDLHPEFESRATSSLGRLSIKDIDFSNCFGSGNPLALMLREFRVWRRIAIVLNEIELNHSVDEVFFPYADYCLYAIGILGNPSKSAKVSGICMRPSFHIFKKMEVGIKKSFFESIKESAFKCLLRRKFVGSIFSIDPMLVDYIKKKGYVGGEKIEYFPDPVDYPVVKDRSSVRTKLGISEDSLVLLVYGAIDERKNIELLISAFHDESVSASWIILIVGKQTDKMRAFLANKNIFNSVDRRIIVVDDYVDEAQEQDFFTAADVVWSAYKAHYAMSGVLVKAGVYSKASICSDIGLIGYFAREYKVGIPVRNDVSCIVDALKELEIPTRRSTIGMQSYLIFKNYSWHNARDLILGSMR